MWTARSFLFSQPFVDACNEEKMDVYYAASTRSAERTGACVRCQLQGKSSATSDVFFWGESGDYIRKSDGWNKDGTIVWNKKEMWKKEHVFPLQRNVIRDGIEFNLVANPREVLLQQYGPRVENHVPARSNFVSHLVIFFVFKFVTLDSCRQCCLVAHLSRTRLRDKKEKATS